MCRTAGGVKPPLSWHMTTPPVYLGGRAQGEREPPSIKNINSLLDALKVVRFRAAPFPRFSAQWFAQWFNTMYSPASRIPVQELIETVLILDTT
jgi:hypothetical protein